MAEKNLIDIYLVVKQLHDNNSWN